MNSLKEKTINGLFWTVSERISSQIIKLIVSIFLARLLEPSEFGLISMLLIFTALAQSIVDSGFGTAFIQKKDADQKDASSIFFFNISIGVLFAGILSLASPLIAEFFQEPILAPITRVLSLVLIINAFSFLQNSILTKTMNFKTQMQVSLIETLTSGVIGIILAYKGFGVWALVIQIISASLLQASLLWFFSSWRPSIIFSLTSLKSMFSFGSKMMVGGIINTFFTRLYETFIGRMFSAVDLGFFTKARTFESSIVQTTSYSLAKVLFPIMVPLQEENNTLKQAFSKTIRLSLFFHFPFMITLLATANPLFRVLLTDKWAPSVPYFQLLCIVGLIYPLHILNLTVLKIKGKSGKILKLEIIKKPLMVLTIIITFRWGILGLLYGMIAYSVIEYFINSFYTKSLIGYSQWEQIKDLLPSLSTSCVMGITMYFISLIKINSYLMMIFMQAIVGVTVYFLISLFSNHSDFTQAKSLANLTKQNLLIKLKLAFNRSK